MSPALFYHLTVWLHRPRVQGTIRVAVWTLVMLAVILLPYIIGGLLGVEPQ